MKKKHDTSSRNAPARSTLAAGSAIFGSNRRRMVDVDKLDEAFEVALAFHHTNTNDPHGISNAVICALKEVKTALKHSLC